MGKLLKLLIFLLLCWVMYKVLESDRNIIERIIYILILLFLMLAVFSGKNTTEEGLKKLVSRIKVCDPNFDEVTFVVYVTELLERIFSIEGEKDLIPLQGEITESAKNQILEMQRVYQEVRAMNVPVVGNNKSPQIMNVKLSGLKQYQEYFNLNLLFCLKANNGWGSDGDYVVVFEKNKIEPKGNEWKYNCPNCGAPKTSLDDKSCKYCSTFINGKGNYWRLSSVHKV